ncbi:MAG: cytochrome c peroxidase [Saprospiraceae bacterium]
MNKKLLITTSLLAALFLLLSFKENEAALALEKTENLFRTRLEEMALSTDQLEAAAENLTAQNTSIEKLRQAHLNARIQYKKVEFLLTYLDGAAVRKNINGAPLPSVVPNVPKVIEIEPSGLQVLDELVFSENPLEEKEKIIACSKKLSHDFEEMRTYQEKVKLTHRHVFEAIRQELVRVFTQGVTGFDTPGSANAIPEARAAFEGMYDAFKNYMPLLTEKDRGLAIVMDARMDYTLQYLAEHNDFESFDRLEFMKNHIEPQYQLFYEIHKVLGIEFAEETDKMPRAVNYHAVSLFAPDFLNAGYYANLDLKEPLMGKRVDLGKTLFFDPILSKDLKLSCASCHQPEKAFTDGQPKSLAANGKEHLKRNSPTLVNAVYSDRYFWDLREPRLDRQMLHVVMSKDEFGTDYIEIINKLKQSSEYGQLFSAAYPEYPEYQISTYTISDALSSYVASLTDFDSPFDRYVRGETSVIDPAVKRGFNLFMGKAACGTCHFAPTFNGTVPPTYDESESEVLGIPTSPDTLNTLLDNDLGRYASGIPGYKADFYKTSFKTVTVRNVALTAPYMHNGVFQTLEEVVDFYTRGGGAGLGLDVPHQTLPFDKLELTQPEQADIVAFMKSLTGDMSKFMHPERLPIFENQTNWNNRKIGGQY